MDPDETTEPQRAPEGAELKTATADVHVVDGNADGEGVFEALVACFGSVDSVGDEMVKGCFVRSLVELGWPAPVWTHDWDTPPIGTCLAIEERDEGLWTRTQLFLDVSPTAQQVHAALTRKSGDGRPPLRQFSFAFRAIEAEWLEVPDHPDADPWGYVRYVKDVDLYEYGPTLVGAHPDTRLLDAKSVHAAAAKRRPTLVIPDAPKAVVPDTSQTLLALTGRR